MTFSYVFIRDDDVWTLDRAFEELFDVLKAEHIPVIYGVIPCRLDDGMACFLRSAKKRDAGLLDIVQHGFDHKNYAAPGERKYEFGTARTYRQQYVDFSQGMAIMRSRFGQEWTPGFIPPYHGYDKTTLQIVKSLRIPIFSAGKRVVCSGKSFLDLPARVSLNEYDQDGTPRPYDLNRMVAKATQALAPAKVVGMVYHHRVIRSSSDMKAIRSFLYSIARWREQGRVRIILFSDLLRLKGVKEGERDPI